MTQDEHQMMLTRQAVEREGRGMVKHDVGAFRANCSNTYGDFLETSSRQYGDGGLWVEITEKGKNSSVLLHNDYVRSLRNTLNAYLGEPVAVPAKPNRPIGYILSSNYQQSATVAVNDWGWRRYSSYEFERPDGGIVQTVANVDALRGVSGVTVYRGDRFPSLSCDECNRLNRMIYAGHVRLVYPESKQPEPHHFWLGEAA